jgi:hypothetical protein
MTFPLAQQSLAGLSQAAAELWDLLTHSQTVEEEAELLAAIWETQKAQEDAIRASHRLRQRSSRRVGISA